MYTHPKAARQGMHFLTVVAALTLVSCQSSSTGNLQSAKSEAVEPQKASMTTASEPISEQAAQSSNLCSIRIAGGPPPIPARGKDFGAAVTSNVGKAVKRGVIKNIGARLGGGLGASVAGGLANSTIRNEEDIKGIWTITDTSRNCGCTIAINSIWKLAGKGKDKGTAKPKACGNPQLQQIANWALGYSFSGYDAKFELKAKNKRTVIATLNRDGIHYFSGKLANGTPVTMWRSGQNYAELRKQ